MINQVVLTGRLTKDPDMRVTPSGTSVTTFTLAVNRNYTNEKGEKEADFISCVAWKKTAENIANFFKKGSLIGVTGRIATRSYEDTTGKRIFVTEINVNEFTFLESRKEQQDQQPVPQPYNRY